MAITVKIQQIPKISTKIDTTKISVFDGNYEYEPSEQEQILPIAGKTAKENIVIKKYQVATGK